MFAARRRTTDQHRDPAVEVEPLEIIGAQRRRLHGLADEHRRRLDFGLRFVEVGQRQELVLEAQRDAAPVAIDGKARALALARRLEQRHALDERAVVAGRLQADPGEPLGRSEEHTSELRSLMRISYAVFCLKKKNNTHTDNKL